MINQISSYDVFLTFNSEDAHFAEIIKKTLSDRGITFTFYQMLSEDDNGITLDLLNILENSKTFMFVFSENLFASALNLQILLEMIDYVSFTMLAKQQYIVAVYYNVKPYNMIPQTHEEDYFLQGDDRDAVLTENLAASYGGSCAESMFNDGDGSELEFIKNILLTALAKQQYNIVPVYFDYNVKPYDLIPQTQEDYLLQRNRDTMQRENLAAYNRRARAESMYNNGDGSEHEFINKFVKRMIGLYSLRSRNTISYRIREYFKTKTKWRAIGVMSTIVGLLCYTLSPCFGRWNIVKVLLTVLVSFLIITTLLFAEKSSPSTQLKKPQNVICFMALIIISVYSFFYEKAVNNKPETLSAVSNLAFALVSLSLHKLLKFGFEIGPFSFFLGVFTIQLLTIYWMLIIVAIIIDYPLFLIHLSTHD